MKNQELFLKVIETLSNSNIIVKSRKKDSLHEADNKNLIETKDNTINVSKTTNNGDVYNTNVENCKKVTLKLGEFENKGETQNKRYTKKKANSTCKNCNGPNIGFYILWTLILVLLILAIVLLIIIVSKWK